MDSIDHSVYRCKNNDAAAQFMNRWTIRSIQIVQSDAVPDSKRDEMSQSLQVKEVVFVEHWDVLQGEVLRADSVSGLPRFGESFSY